MADVQSGGFCPDEILVALASAMNAGDRNGMRDLDDLLRNYPTDARLHFLKGSMLAAQQDFAAARVAFRRSVNLAPDYGVARFQLGLLLLSSGEAVEAQEVWAPLHALPDTNYLHLFAKGLGRMISDDFGSAIELLREGIERNKENAPMNRDMQLVISTMEGGKKGDAEESAMSSVDFLLQQSTFRSRH